MSSTRAQEWRKRYAVVAGKPTAADVPAVPSPLWNVFPHEGSFYPVHLLRSFVHALNATPYFDSIRTHPHRCPCCPLYGPRYGKSGGGGACAFEEILLPTFARQHYAHLVPSAAPSVVLRLWLDLHAVARLNRSASLNALAKAVQSSRSFGHFFGLKVPRFAYAQLESALEPTLRGH